MRHRLWGWLRSSRPACEILPWWFLLIRAVLFPIDTLYWRLSRTRGYQWESDTWIIEGVRWSPRAIARLPEHVGRVFLVTRDGDELTFVWMPEFDKLVSEKLAKDAHECRDILQGELGRSKHG